MQYSCLQSRESAKSNYNTEEDEKQHSDSRIGHSQGVNLYDKLHYAVYFMIKHNHPIL